MIKNHWTIISFTLIILFSFSISAEENQELPENKIGRWFYFTEHETAPIWEHPSRDIVRFWDKDEIWGPLRTNDTIHIRANNYGLIRSGQIEYGPNFYGHVKSAAQAFDIIGGGKPTFHQGYKLGVEKFYLPHKAEAARNNAVIKINKEDLKDELGQELKCTITFFPDGNMKLEKTHVKLDARPVDMMPEPETFITPGFGNEPPGSIFIDGLVEVQGEVAGWVTVAASKNIRILDNIIYADNPVLPGTQQKQGEPSRDSKNFLALVSEQNVMIANTPKNRRGQIFINAVIVALGDGGRPNSGDWTTGGGAFSVEDINLFVPCQDISGEYFIERTSRTKLNLWGAIAQRYRGFVRRSNKTEGWSNSNYSQKIFEYDQQHHTAAPRSHTPTSRQSAGYSFKNYHYDWRLNTHDLPDLPEFLTQPDQKK